MREFTSKTVRDLKPSGIRKFFDMAARIPGCVSLGVGEPDYDTPWHVTEKAAEAAASGLTFYTANNGMPELREEIVRWNKRHYGLDYSPEEVLATVGASEAIDLVFRACLEPGDEVIVPEPCYVCYQADVIMAGGKPIPLPLQAKNEFRLTPEELRSVITPKTKAIIVNYPNNPTGAIMGKEDWEKLIPLFEEYDLLVITDEIYSELTYGGDHVCLAAFPGMKERTIYINGFSKAFAMTGWRLGYAMGPKDIIDQMKKIHAFTIMCASSITQYAGIEALKNGDEDIVKMRNEYNERRKFMLQEFARMGLPCFEPKGAFYLFPYVGDYCDKVDDFCVELLQEEKLVVVPGTAFGGCGEGFIRISYAYSTKDLKEGLARLERFLKKIAHR